MSRYPTLSRSDAIEVAMSLLVGTPSTIEDKVVWRGEGDDVDLLLLDHVLTTQRQDFERSAKRDPEVIEGRLAAAVYPMLACLAPTALDDEGFWRYLAVSRFWWFIEWREAGPLSRGNVATYVDGRRPTESIPVRLFMRAHSARDDSSDDISPAWALARSADFWRSHILRVRAVTSPSLVRAFVAFQEEHQLGSTEVRAIAKLINRSWSNLVLTTYDDIECRRLLEELYEQVAARRPAGRGGKGR